MQQYLTYQYYQYYLVINLIIHANCFPLPPHSGREIGYDYADQSDARRMALLRKNEA